MTRTDISTASEPRQVESAPLKKKPEKLENKISTNGSYKWNSILKDFTSNNAQASALIRSSLAERPKAPNVFNHAKVNANFIDLTFSDDDNKSPIHKPVRKHRKVRHDSETSSGTSTSRGNRELSITTSRVEVIVPIREVTQPVKSKAYQKFAQQLRQIKGPAVLLRNDIDDTAPPSNFCFVDEYVFSKGTSRLAKEFQSGCDCRPDNGRHMGCEYLSCYCLEDAARQENGKPLGFAYYATEEKKGCLRELYLNSRHAIYECNELCNCLSNCKNKIVQKGRQIPLEIFKTEKRGWGLRTLLGVRKGQFIDTYRGEVITDREATLREKRANKGKDSYLFNLDKFRGVSGDDDFIPDKDLYVVDGEFMGGPTRFMNHSCDPNCRQFTASLYRGDNRVYELPFFAIEDIPAGTELTFNYLDDDDDTPISDKDAIKLSKEKGQEPTKCHCGEDNCRRFLWL